VSFPKINRTVLPAAAAMLAAAIVPSAAEARHPSHQREPAKMADDDSSQAVANLPYARGRSFGTLDEYLAFRREGGAIDLPWYREVRPGLYKLETGNLRPAGPERYFTRDELERKFGFAR
jgi:hypothetical protein